MFITFEGIDFCGKTTQVKLLRNFLEDQNKIVKIIREPGGTEISEKIREILLNKDYLNMCFQTEVFLFSASRSQLVREKIIPFLLNDYFVISDRFHDSTIAYQGYGRGIPLKIIEHINQLAIGDAIPDITFFLDIPIEVADERKRQNSLLELDRMEISQSEFFQKVRQGYFKIAEKEKRFRVIDGTLSIDVIHKKIVKEILNLQTKRLKND
ncbi:MAG: dTMP kinase [Ignavibacterium sp.]